MNELTSRNSQIIWYSWNRKFNLLKVLQCINFVAHKYHGNNPQKPVEMRVFHQGTILFQEESDFFYGILLISKSIIIVRGNKLSYIGFGDIVLSEKSDLIWIIYLKSA